MNPLALKQHAEHLGPAFCRQKAQEFSRQLQRAGRRKEANAVANDSYTDPLGAYLRGYFMVNDPDAPKAPESSNGTHVFQTLEEVRAALATETDPDRKWALGLQCRELRGHAGLFA